MSVVLSVLLNSENFNGKWLVFITEYEFDNTDMECRYVSGVRTYRSAQWCLNLLYQLF